MGSLHPFSGALSPQSPSSKHVNQPSLLHLFNSQQNHLIFVFNNIDHSQTLAFTRTLFHTTNTIFSGVGKSGFVAHKISQTLVSLGIRSAGRIGKSLIFKVKDVMNKEDEPPICREADLIMDQLVELTSKACGCLLVIDEQHHLTGTLTSQS